MILKTLGHASLLLGEEKKPLLITDPWLYGTCYWNSWGLKRYPTKKELSYVNKTKFAFITHEHQDHLHPETLYKLNKKITYLIPNFIHPNVKNFFKREKKFKYKILKKDNWFKIGDKTFIYYIHMWNDDTILLIKNKNRYILNINDAFPGNLTLRKIKRITKNKNLIVLKSYSPASLINSMFLNNKRLIVFKKIFFYKRIQKLCNFLNAKFYIPFASQVFFLRKDSKWANSYSVNYQFLKKNWNCKSILLPEYVKFNLENLKIENKYKELKSKKVEKIEKNLKSKGNEIYNFDLFRNNLLKKFKSLRIILFILFPRGIIFSFTDKKIKMKYSTYKNKLIVRKNNFSNYSIRIHAPYGPVYQSITENFLEDVGIGMFTKIYVKSKFIGPLTTYLLFNVLLPMTEHDHLSSFKRFRLWFANYRQSLF